MREKLGPYFETLFKATREAECTAFGENTTLDAAFVEVCDLCHGAHDNGPPGRPGQGRLYRRGRIVQRWAAGTKNRADAGHVVYAHPGGNVVYLRRWAIALHSARSRQGGRCAVHGAEADRARSGLPALVLRVVRAA